MLDNLKVWYSMPFLISLKKVCTNVIIYVNIYTEREIEEEIT